MRQNINFFAPTYPKFIDFSTLNITNAVFGEAFKSKSCDAEQIQFFHVEHIL